MTAIEKHWAEIIDILLAAHKEASDQAAKPLAAMLAEYGDVVASKGTIGQDYLALIEWDGRTWLVEANNGWDRVYDPADADYDYKAVLGIEEDADAR